jgi:hypothetical protein
MKQLQFYAVVGDLLPVLQAVEDRGPLKYVLTGNFTTPDLQTFLRGSQLPNLGKATCDSATGSDSFLVCQPELQIIVRHLPGTGGIERFCVDQLANPETVTLTPGGIWNEDIVLYGCVGTASGSEASQELMRRFAGAIKKQFTKIKAVYVGPKACELLDAGKRLTLAAQTPKDFDLTRD